MEGIAGRKARPEPLLEILASRAHELPRPSPHHISIPARIPRDSLALRVFLSAFSKVCLVYHPQIQRALGSLTKSDSRHLRTTSAPIVNLTQRLPSERDHDLRSRPRAPQFNNGDNCVHTIHNATPRNARDTTPAAYTTPPLRTPPRHALRPAPPPHNLALLPLGLHTRLPKRRPHGLPALPRRKRAPAAHFKSRLVPIPQVEELL